MMEGPLWIERHRPGIEELPQPDIRTYLGSLGDGPVNLILHGPPGCGKTAAVYALADELHAAPEQDLITLNVADFFGMTKREIADDPRFRGFLDSDRKRGSKAAMINHILSELASYPPVSGSFKTILLDNAEAMREDFQQALRRIMERHYAATQFIFTTRRGSALILPIQSRCAQVPVRAPTSAEVVSVLEHIIEKEGVDYDHEGLEYVAGYADGDLRRAILAAQTTAEEAGELSMDAAYETLDDVGRSDRLLSLLELAEDGSFTDARSLLNELLIDDGYGGTELLAELVRVARTRYEPDRVADITALAGTIEFDLVRGANDRVHLAHFLTRLNTSTSGSSQ